MFVEFKEGFIETLRRAVYASIPCAFYQGLELIARASRDEIWNVNLGMCIKIWRAGCVICSDSIADVLEPILSSSTGTPTMNLKLIDEVCAELHKNYKLLQIMTKGMEWNALALILSASLEYLKYVGGRGLPTQFMEAEMECFRGRIAVISGGWRGRIRGGGRRGHIIMSGPA